MLLSLNVPPTPTGIKLGSQNKSIHLRDFKDAFLANMDFNFPHIETEESFGLVWVKLRNG